MLKRNLDVSKTAFPHSEVWLEREEDDITLRVKCTECGEIYSKRLSPTELGDVELLYAHGGHHPDGHVQDVFPDWSCSERELFLMSHICDLCWKTMFGEDE